MYLILVLTAIFKPRTLYKRIACKHPEERSVLIDLGRDKTFWCNDCGYQGFAVSGAAV